jgi:hypothetical protein
MKNPAEDPNAATIGRARFYHFFPPADLAETAALLGEVLGVEFAEEKSGFFEEIPAFDGCGGGLHFALLGIPDPKYDGREIKNDDFELHIKITEDRFRSTQEVDALLAERLSRLPEIQLRPSERWT